MINPLTILHRHSSQSPSLQKAIPEYCWKKKYSVSVIFNVNGMGVLCQLVNEIYSVKIPINKTHVALRNSRRRKMQSLAFLLSIAATATLLPTSDAANLLRTSSSSDGGSYALNQPALGGPELGGSPLFTGIGAISPHFTPSEHLDTSIQGAPETSLQESLLESNTPLDGYFVVATYSGNTCTTEIVADATLLNSCMKDTTNGGTEYMKLTATSSYSFKTFYFDKECTQVISVRKPQSYLVGCTSGTLTYVSTNSIPPSTTLMASQRYSHNCHIFSVFFIPTLTILLLFTTFH